VSLRSAARHGGLAAVAAIALVVAGCNDDGADTTTTEVAPTTSITTMAPQPTLDMGDELNGTLPEGGPDTTIAGAVPGQDIDRLDPPGGQAEP
jgi:hypothetical protein